MANLLNRKKILIEHIKYINNVVVLPRAEYKLNMVMLSKHECDKLHQPVIRIAKWKAELASTASNTIPLQKDIWGINSLWQQHTEHMISEWVIRINNPNLVGDLTRMRLRDAQLLLRSTVPIWALNNDEIKKLK